MLVKDNSCSISLILVQILSLSIAAVIIAKSFVPFLPNKLKAIDWITSYCLEPKATLTLY